MPGPFSIPAEKMREILEVSRLLAITADLDLLLVEIARSAAALLGAERASIFLHDAVADQLWTKVALGADPIRVPASAGIVGNVFRAGKPLNIPDAYADARFNRQIDLKTGYVTRNLLTTPMLDLSGRVIGVVQAVNKIGGIFGDEDEQTLELLASQSGVAVQRYHLQCEAIHVGELRREMDLAKGVQESMLPRHPPQIAGLEAVGWNQSASTTGGDSYDLWRITDGKMGVFLGDAAGHGLAPALEVLQARTLVRALSDINADPRWILSNINRRLSMDLKLGHFVTCFVGCLSSGGYLDWCSAGHGPILYRQGPGQTLQRLEPLAPPVAVDDEFVIEDARGIHLDSGGMLVVLSDGIFEAMSADGSLFGVERVIGVLDATHEAELSAQMDALRQAVREWQGKDEPVDDQTVVLIRRK